MKGSVTLKDWLDSKRAKDLAKEMDVQLASIYQWKSGRHLPCVEEMRKIKKLSKGKVSYDIMIENFLDNRMATK